MRRYANAVDLRSALEARLKQQADESGTDVSRLRRIAVFDRVGARLSAADRRWVLKGGTSLEFRLGVRARATKDLDLTLLDGPGDGDVVREELIETLGMDVDHDGFMFSVKPPTLLDADAAGRPGWRFSVNSTLAGKIFAQIRLDVVLRGEELAATEKIALPATHGVPRIVPDPPPAWATDYPRLAEGRTRTKPDLAAGLDLFRSFWTQTLTTETER